MKQIFAFLTIFSLIGANHSFAQSGSGKIKYGVKAGFNLPTYSMSSERLKNMKEDGFKRLPLISFHVGGYADYAVSTALSIQAGLTISGKGYKERWSGEDELDGYSYEGNYKENVISLEVPINAVYKTGNLYFGAGPYIGYALSGKWLEKYEEDWSDGNIEHFDDESGKIIFTGENAFLKPLDFGVNVLAGYQLNNNISIGAGYGIGLRNLETGSIGEDKYWSVKNRVLSISVNYIFK